MRRKANNTRAGNTQNTQGKNNDAIGNVIRLWGMLLSYQEGKEVSSSRDEMKESEKKNAARIGCRSNIRILGLLDDRAVRRKQLQNLRKVLTESFYHNSFRNTNRAYPVLFVHRQDCPLLVREFRSYLD